MTTLDEAVGIARREFDADPLLDSLVLATAPDPRFPVMKPGTIGLARDWDGPHYTGFYRDWDGRAVIYSVCGSADAASLDVRNRRAMKPGAAR